jgi:hypothetical protein
MMHAIGFHHEHVRPDRDEWITVNRKAIVGKYQTDAFFNANFGKYVKGLTYDIEYDYGSVMHYSKWGFAASFLTPVISNNVSERQN